MSVYIIAECGINHQGNIDTAYEMIKVAAEAGADPDEFKWYVEAVREAEQMLGDGIIRVEKGAEKNLWIKEQYNLSKEK